MRIALKRLIVALIILVCASQSLPLTYAQKAVGTTSLQGVVDKPFVPRLRRTPTITAVGTTTLRGLVVDLEESRDTVHESPPNLTTDQEEVIEDTFVVQQVPVANKLEDCLFRFVELRAPDTVSAFLKDSDYIVTQGTGEHAGDFVLKTTVRNIGLISEGVSLHARISDYFGHTEISEVKEFELGELSQTDITLNLGDMPWYRMGFTVVLYAEYTPLGLMGQGYDPAALGTESVDYINTFFLFPRWLIWLLMLLISLTVILWNLSRRRRERKLTFLEEAIKRKLAESRIHSD